MTNDMYGISTGPVMVTPLRGLRIIRLICFTGHSPVLRDEALSGLVVSQGYELLKVIKP